MVTDLLTLRGGRGGPIVLVHGLMGRGSTWSRQVPWLTALGEVETLGRMNARVIVMVLDDGAYGAEVRKLPPETRPLAMFGRRDLACAARALGVPAATAKDAASLLDAMAQAAAATGPFLVHAHVDPAVQQNVF